MNIIVKPRQSGKTTELIKNHDNYDGYIVVHSKKEAQRVEKYAEELGYEINTPITYYNFLQKNYLGLNISKFSIDNLDDFLHSITSVPIENVTMTEIIKEPSQDITFEYYGRNIVVTQDVLKLMKLLNYEFGQVGYVEEATKFQLEYKELFEEHDIYDVGYYFLNPETEHIMEVNDHSYNQGKYYNPFITDWNWLMKVCEKLNVKILDYDIEKVYKDVIDNLKGEN